jgi:hypothetical protein
MVNLLDVMFGCSHKRTTFPLTPLRRDAMSSEGARKGTYVVCLDCGKEFSYSWREMQMGERVDKRYKPASILQNSGKETEAASALSMVDSASHASAATAKAIAMR